MKQGAPKNNTVPLLPAKGTISNRVKDYSNDSFFVKKAAQARKRIEQVGFPEAFLAKKPLPARPAGFFMLLFFQFAGHARAYAFYVIIHPF